MKKDIYSDQFFKDRTGPLKSAEHIIPILLELVTPKSVIDVGCGTGEFLYVFQKKGVKDVLGVDGEWVSEIHLCIPNHLFLSADLEKPLRIGRKFDLVISLEVAEHLYEKHAETFIETLANLGSVILFSAAIPFQGGVHHVNEQWPEYWAKLFLKKGYFPIDCIRKKIWNNEEVSVWYSQNTILFVEKEFLDRNPKLKNEFKKTENIILPLVHPKIYTPIAKKCNKISKCIPLPIKWILNRFI